MLFDLDEFNIKCEKESHIR